MPRKKINIDDTKKKTKKNLINTMFKENVEDEHIILQLPLTQQRINNLINNEVINVQAINEPAPYESSSYFMNDAENILFDNNKEINHTDNRNNSACFWCCHNIEHNLYGMPYNYDTMNDTYLIYGSFCSLQCANAYNFSIHSGSDKVWEINSWIQMLGKRYGYLNTIRPAPSRYLLKLFGGNMTIEEYREAHINNDKTFILNIPPMISIATNSEIINTSHLTKLNDKKKKNIQNFLEK